MTDAVPVRLGVILLCHEDLDKAAHMVRLWHGGDAAVAVHVDLRTPDSQVDMMRAQLADLENIVWVDRRKCEWGMFAMVQVTQDSATALLDRFVDVSHVLVASGSCLPLRPIAELTAYLARHPGQDFIESVNAAEVGWTVGGLNVERFERYFPVSWRKHRRLFDRLVNLQRRFNIKRKMPQGLVAHLGSQWWCMTRATLLAILNDPRRPEFDRFFKTVWIPDESYFQSLARRQSIAIESQSLTVSNFDDQGKPYILYDDHAEMLALSRCFVARKVWSGADKLLSRFPERAGAEHVNDEPRSGRIERIIGAAVKRRRLGRPGLYMQSRFPRENAENGKTAAPYAMLHGFVDLFPDFEKWLQSRVDGDVHGHLFGTDMVEFAGRPTVGPGCLSTHPASRDYDPDGFLTSLIRISDRQQIFQFSPRDRQQLNWFTATDPNATIRMITGAWIVPLMHSDMPFDDVRRMAAILQRTELAHLDILDSVWVKANVEKWDLADFAARPAAILQRVVNDLSFGGWPLYDTPPALRDLTEVGSFLRSLRNAGLQPRNIGDFSPFQTENEWHD